MPEAPQPLSVVESYRGRHILLTGGSGFLGKVYLGMLLEHVPEVGRIYVFMRPGAVSSGQARFENMLNTSEAFRPLHRKFGAGLSRYLADRVEVVEGELSEPGLGLSAGQLQRLRTKLDLVIHCAGLVDFAPDLGKGLASNVTATLQIADFVQSCERATLLHISTCFVAGCQSGFVPEVLKPNYCPVDQPFDAEAEYQQAQQVVRQVVAEFAPGGSGHRELQEALVEEQARHPTWGDAAKQGWLRKQVRERTRSVLVDEGKRRAKALGFPNVYTYTKSLAESLLQRRRGQLRFAVLRPSIVESARHYPFPGWNESFNGSAPLAYVMGGWFRMVPARPQNAFDVIPVDEVSKAMALCGAALISGCAREVYHIGTSDKFPCPVGRSAELIALAHRKYHRGRERSQVERIVKSRWDAVLVSQDHLLGVDGLDGGLRATRHVLDLLPPWWRPKLEGFETRLDDFEDRLADIRKLVELYMPFMHDHGYIFESRAIDHHPAQEPEFGFLQEPMDWRHYWVDVHVPGLRRYAFPLIEGRRPPRYRAAHRVRLAATLPADTGRARRRRSTDLREH